MTELNDPKHKASVTGVGASVGVAGGVAGGAAAGAAVVGMTGPVGAAVGAAVGAVAGALAGRTAKADPAEEDAYWRGNYTGRPYVESGSSYDDYAPACRSRMGPSPSSSSAATPFLTTLADLPSRSRPLWPA
jgi:hypothetical protein